MEYLICYKKGDMTMYLTELPNDENPFSGIGFQGSTDSIPVHAGTCSTIEDAEKVIAYLNENQSGYREQNEYFYMEDPRNAV